MIRRALGLALIALVVPVAAHASSPAQCGARDRVEPGLQGQVPWADRASGRAADGYSCNLELVGSRPGVSFANFDTYRDCAYYTDNAGGYEVEGGAVVLDVSDPRHPVQTDHLTARAMGNGGESLRVNAPRGLLVSDHYNFTGEDEETTRTLAVYDVSRDCRHPRLLADVVMPSAVGHEGCFQPDGRVYYMSSLSTVTPIDLSDPSHPRQLSEPWDLPIHGCSLSDDGRRGYFADQDTGGVSVLDTSAAQAGVRGAQPRKLGYFATPDAVLQQSTIPISYHGQPFLLDWSEAKGGTGTAPCGDPGKPTFGYPRILDLADESKPVEVSRLLTEVMLPENCAAVAGDRTAITLGNDKGDAFWEAGSALFLYDSHMCSVDRAHDPTIAACVNFGSGLRVYDIRDPDRPREIAYYNTGTVSPTDPTLDFAVARPVIRSDLGQIWWVTLLGGFHAARFRDGVWPFAGTPACPAGDPVLAQYDLRCGAPVARRRRTRSRAVRLRLRAPAGARAAALHTAFACRLYANGGI